MEKKTNSKFIHNFMNMFCVLIQLINDTLKLVPFGLVMGPVILFCFSHGDVPGAILHEWQKSAASEKVSLVLLYLKTTFVCVFMAVFLRYLFSVLRKGGNKEKGFFIYEEQWFSLLEKVSAFDEVRQWAENSGAYYPLLECRRLTDIEDVRKSEDILNRLEFIDRRFREFISIMSEYNRNDKSKDKWERELSEYPPKKIYQVRREGDHLSLKNYGDDITLNRDTAVATVQITVSKKCITQEEMDELYALSERLKEQCAGN